MLDWRRPTARDLVDRVRGCNPWPGVTTVVAGGALTLWRARAVAGSAASGTLVRHERTLAVATGEGAVLPLEVQPESRRAIGWDEFLRGARLTAGQRLVTSDRGGGKRPPLASPSRARVPRPRVRGGGSSAGDRRRVPALALDAELRRRALPLRDVALATDVISARCVARYPTDPRPPPPAAAALDPRVSCCCC